MSSKTPRNTCKEAEQKSTIEQALVERARSNLLQYVARAIGVSLLAKMAGLRKVVVLALALFLGVSAGGGGGVDLESFDHGDGA